jgi:hypothetical protein
MDVKYLSHTLYKLQNKLYNIEKIIFEFEENIHIDWNSYEPFNLHYFDKYDFFMDQISSKSYKKLILKKSFIESQIDFIKDFYKITI